MEQEVEKTPISSVISNAIFQFALTSLHKYATIKPEEDFVFSPYSIYQELFSAYLISSGNIEQRLKQILYLPNVTKHELMKIINFHKYPACPQDAASYLPQHYVIQNKCIFLNIILRKNIKIIEKLYNVGFTSKKSNDIQDINRKMNKILKAMTKDCIIKPLELEVKREAMDIILMNVHKFHGQSTDKSLELNQLLSTSSLILKTFFSDELQMDVRELIINEYFTLYVLTPSSSITNDKVKTDASSTSLSNLIERLSTSEGMRVLRELLSCVRTGGLLYVATRPTFHIEKTFDMQVLLRELGVEQLLTPDAIPLDNTFAEDNQFVHFGNAVHRARVEVTKKNVTAAAVTLISGQEFSSNDIISNMYLNYPFVWLIYDKKNAYILYIGVFNKAGKCIGVSNEVDKYIGVSNGVDKYTGVCNKVSFTGWMNKML